MLRLVLAGAVIVLIAVAYGGGDSPTQTVAQNGSSGSEATAVPTSTVAQEGSGGSDLTVAEIAAYCGEISDLAEEGEYEAETWGEEAQRVARLQDRLEDLTPPEELKGYHNALAAIYKSIYDFYRSEDANKPLDEAEYFASSEFNALTDDFADALEALGFETVSQLNDTGCL